MKKIAFLFLTLLISNISVAQSEDIIGKTNKEKLLSTSHQSWFEENYNTFKPQPQSTEQLSQLIKNHNYKIKVYFGTWCSDSQREVPRLIKLLERSNFNFKNLELIGVDRDKNIPNVSIKEEKSLNISNVPTIIVYEKGKEINRFVEYAQESLETDLIKILAQKPYKHSYQY